MPSTLCMRLLPLTFVCMFSVAFPRKRDACVATCSVLQLFPCSYVSASNLPLSLHFSQSPSAPLLSLLLLRCAHLSLRHKADPYISGHILTASLYLASVVHALRIRVCVCLLHSTFQLFCSHLFFLLCRVRSESLFSFLLLLYRFLRFCFQIIG